MWFDWIKEIVVWSCGHKEMIEDIKLYKNQHGCYIKSICKCFGGKVTCKIPPSIYDEIKTYQYQRDCLC